MRTPRQYLTDSADCVHHNTILPLLRGLDTCLLQLRSRYVPSHWESDMSLLIKTALWILQSTTPQSKTAKMVRLLTCTLDVSFSNLDRATDYRDWNLSWFFSVLQAESAQKIRLCQVHFLPRLFSSLHYATLCSLGYDNVVNWTTKEFGPRERGFPIVTCDAVPREWIGMVVNQ